MIKRVRIKTPILVIFNYRKPTRQQLETVEYMKTMQASVAKRPLLAYSIVYSSFGLYTSSHIFFYSIFFLNHNTKITYSDLQGWKNPGVFFYSFMEF